MDRKVLALIFLLFSFFAKSQSIFTTTFRWFPFDTTTGTAGWTHDDTLLTHFGYGSNNTDLIGATDLTISGGFDHVSGFSLLSRNGKYLRYQGTTDYMHAGDNHDPGTSDFTLQVWVLTPADVATNKYIVNKRDGSDGWQVDVFNNEFRAGILGETFAKQAVVAGTNYYLWARFDRDGNLISAAYGNSTVLFDTVDISGSSASDINVAQNFTIGAYSVTPSSGEWDGGVYAVKYSASALPDQKLVEDIFLAESWKSGGGNVYRDSFGFHQMVLNTGKNALTVGLKDGTQSAMDIITSDSTRYTMQFSGITSLSSDSLIFVAGGDSVWRALSDSTFAANRGLQVVFDAWTETRFTAPTGDWATIDNITVSTYALAPEISVNPTSYDYGDITVNDSDSVYVKIINTGDGDLSVTNIVPQDADLVTLSATSFTISSNDSDSVLVKIFPTDTGTVYDTLTITNNDADEGSLEVPLEVNGLALPSSSTAEEKRKLAKYNRYFKLGEL